jgi:DNA-binding LacI/PurR family transcriptional regulator
MMEAHQRNHTLFIDETEGSLDQERDIARGYPSRGINGIVFCPVSISLDELEELKSDIPTVLLGEHLSGGSFDHIAIDSYRSACEAAEHLVSAGRRRFAFVGTRLAAPAGPAHFRVNGLRDALGRHGIGLNEQLVVEADSHSREEGRRVAEALIESGAEVDAIVCAADLLAVGVLAALRDHDVRVPDDVAVMGWDDSPEGHYTAPPLTSIAHDMRELARRAIDSIELRQQDPTLEPKHVVVPHWLTVRASTVPVALGHSPEKARGGVVLT